MDTNLYYRTLFLESLTDAFATTQIVDPTGRSGRFAGHQIDARARYWIVPQLVRIEFGVDYLIKGTFLRNAPNVQDKKNVTYGYTALNIAF